jgi:hypothetical protein
MIGTNHAVDLTIEYFDFEQDFMDDNIRCIPMIVRFKLDSCGIKLKLKEWNKMTVVERESMATLPINSSDDLNTYRKYVEELIQKHTGENPTILEVQDLSSLSTHQLPQRLQDKLAEQKMNITINQWKNLRTLQRYALLKLTRPGHENKNFPKAMKEFGLA